MKLNQLDRNYFETSKENDIRVNAGSGANLSRNKIIAGGRLVLCEYIGGQLNLRPDTKGQYVSRLNGMVYADFARKVTEETLVYCGAIANQTFGKSAAITFEDIKKDPSYARNEIFVRTLAEVAREVIQPVFFAIMDDVAADNLMRWEPVPFGGTKEIDIASNDVFLFEDSAWGSAHSASYNTLYGKTLTLNPRPFTTQAKIKWYQLAVNGDIGQFYAAIIRGMWNKIYAMFIETLVSSVGNPAYIPAGLSASTYTSANWNQITTLVAAANGIKRDNLMAFGTIKALSSVLPTDGTGGAIVGLQYGLGEEWVRRGYLPNVAGVQILEVTPSIVPGTQNSTLETIGIPDDTIIIAAKGGYGYAPIYAGYYEGSPLMLELRPEQTGDLTIDLTATAMFDIKPVFASKVGTITDIA